MKTIFKAKYQGRKPPVCKLQVDRAEETCIISATSTDLQRMGKLIASGRAAVNNHKIRKIDHRETHAITHHHAIKENEINENEKRPVYIRHNDNH